MTNEPNDADLDAADDDWDDHYTPAFRARCHLTVQTTAFPDGTRPTIDPDRCGGTEFPEQFERLVAQWGKCLDAAVVINQRYHSDWNQAGGVLTVIAPKVRETALKELDSVWNTLVDNYVTETLDRDRQPWDCPFCGENVPKEHVWDDDRCPSCMCILWKRGDETDWTNNWDETH